MQDVFNSFRNFLVITRLIYRASFKSAIKQQNTSSTLYRCATLNAKPILSWKHASLQYILYTFDKHGINHVNCHEVCLGIWTSFNFVMQDIKRNRPKMGEISSFEYCAYIKRAFSLLALGNDKYDVWGFDCDEQFFFQNGLTIFLSLFLSLSLSHAF